VLNIGNLLGIFFGELKKGLSCWPGGLKNEFAPKEGVNANK
jgi:hypothetical protein